MPTRDDRAGGDPADMQPRSRDLFRKLMCLIGLCTRCRTYSTDDGIGGKCIDCGRIHGWITREELREYMNRRIRQPVGEELEWAKAEAKRLGL